MYMSEAIRRVLELAEANHEDRHTNGSYFEPALERVKVLLTLVKAKDIYLSENGEEPPCRPTNN